MEQARQFLALLTEHSDTCTVDTLCERFGKEKTFIVTSITLCDLIEPLQQVFDANRMSFSNTKL